MEMNFNRDQKVAAIDCLATSFYHWSMARQKYTQIQKYALHRL